MADAVESSLGLALDLTIADRPVTVIGTWTKGGDSAAAALDLYGEAQLDLRLDDMHELGSWLANPAASGLVSALKAVQLETLAVYYTGADRVLQLGLSASLEGGGRFALRLIKGFGVGQESAGGLAVGLDVQTEVELSAPLVKHLLGTVKLEGLNLNWASQAFPELKLLPSSTLPREVALVGPTTAEQQHLEQGVSAHVQLRINGEPLLPQPTAPEPAALSTASRVAQESGAADNASKTKWISVNKKLGPVTIRQVGFELDLEQKRIGVKLDAGLSLAILEFQLVGFGLRAPLDAVTNLVAKQPFSASLKELGERLTPTLDGASLRVTMGPLTIAGGLIKTGDDPLALTGFITVSTSAFSLVAIGAYTTTNDGAASFFVYAALQKDLGGPAFFFVTGVAVGFGINRTLDLPPIDQVESFPLVRAAIDQSYASETPLLEMSKQLSTYIAPRDGAYWLAFGVRFTSFELIESFVLLSVAFGTEVVVGLVGLARLTIPSPAKGNVSGGLVLAYAELALKASFRPERGILKVEALLTPASFVFHESCRISGGFAFYAWFADCDDGGVQVRGGDFVLTVGGYHPLFQRPAHYPVVPRVALSWRISDTVQVRGECYFALTSTALMAGGSLALEFRDAGIHAWFNVHADFLIAWAPLHYDAEVGVQIGVSWGPFSGEVGAVAHIEGPPFGGKVVVDLWFVSFTIPLGDPVSAPPNLPWDKFVTQFLHGKYDPSQHQPGELVKALLSVSVARGLELPHERPPPASQAVQNGEPSMPFVNGFSAQFTIKSKVPLGQWPGYDAASDARTFGIAPMGISALSSTLTATLKQSDSTGKVVSIRVTAVRENVPQALWGTKAPDRTAAPQLVEDVTMGLMLEPEPRTMDRGTPIPREPKTFDARASWSRRTTASLVDRDAGRFELLVGPQDPASSLRRLLPIGFELHAPVSDPDLLWDAEPAARRNDR